MAQILMKPAASAVWLVRRNRQPTRKCPQFYQSHKGLCRISGLDRQSLVCHFPKYLA